MSATRRTVLLGLLGAGFTSASLSACDAGGLDGRLRLAAGQQGGLYLAFAELLAGRLRRRNPSLRVQVLPTAGSGANLALVRRGDADLGLTLADVAEHDRERQREDAPTAVARVYENYIQAVVRAGSGVREVGDLAGRRVCVGPRGSGAAFTGAVLLRVAGLTGEVQLSRYGLRDGLTALAAGRVDAVIWSGGVPTPAIAELDRVHPLRLLDLGERVAAMTAASGFPYLERRVPAVGYAGSGRRTVGVPDLLVCRPGLGGRAVAAVVDVLARDAARLVPAYVRGLQYLDPPAMIQTGRVPLHPAARRAFVRLHG